MFANANCVSAPVNNYISDRDPACSTQLVPLPRDFSAVAEKCGKIKISRQSAHCALAGGPQMKWRFYSVLFLGIC
jgi:hypothetical protein